MELLGVSPTPARNVRAVLAGIGLQIMIGYASELSGTGSCYWPSEALHPCIVMVTRRIDSLKVAGGGAGIICGENNVAQILCGMEIGEG